MKEYTTEQYKNILYSYLIIIKNTADKYPTVAIHDIESSIKGILKDTNYTEEEYKKYNEEQRQKRKRN